MTHHPSHDLYIYGDAYQSPHRHLIIKVKRLLKYLGRSYKPKVLLGYLWLSVPDLKDAANKLHREYLVKQQQETNKVLPNGLPTDLVLNIFSYLPKAWVANPLTRPTYWGVLLKRGLAQ